MDGRGLLPGKVAEALERGAVIITGNQRSSRTLRRAYDQRNRERGLTIWQPPAVLSWDAWLATLWQRMLMEGHVKQLLLNRTQEHAVWRTILEADEELASLRTVDSLAEMAAEAWHLLCRYDGRHRLRGAIGSSDTRAFQRWALTFERVCHAEGFVSRAHLEETLRAELERSSEPAEMSGLSSGGIMLVGFDRLTPEQSRLIDTLQSNDIRVEESSAAISSQSRVLVAATEELQELSLAARWLRNFIDHNPQSRVAVIVPNLEKERGEIDRVFREILAPELEDIRAGDEIGPFEFSLGVKLIEVPMIRVAFDLLRWAMEPLPLERVSGLLLSPYFAMTAEERSARAEFDAFELRKTRLLRPEISLEALIDLMAHARRRSRLSRTLGALRATQTAADRLRGLDSRSNAEWAQKMSELLAAAGWNARKRETSVEFQARRKWEGALDELATLDFAGVLVEFGEALSSLERIAEQTMFATESRDAPVQIMGPLEAAGSTFDAMWFLRAGELSWPMKTASSSLLPWHLKRDLEMPGTDTVLDSKHAKDMSERIAASADHVVFSYAIESPEGRQRPSPVLAGLGLQEIADANDLVTAKADRTIIEIEEVEDAASIPPLPDRVIRGGARILELQAACGFRAFAEQRLRATHLEHIEPGMDVKENGIVVHRALENFWREVKTQSALRSMTKTERNEVLNWCIAEALKKTAEAGVTEWDASYVQVQQDRLRNLLSGWLDLELQRGLPFEVKLNEQAFEDVRVGPLRLNVRVDRVDLVEGGEVLIDYKTGDHSPSAWLTSRPSAPQLPLYAILSEADKLQGIAFGVVRAGEGRALKGYEAAQGVLPTHTKLKEAATLEAQVEQWRKVLVDLAEDFYIGDARVRPKAYPGTCAHCEQRLLCRLDVSELEEEDGLEDGAAEEVSGG